MATTLVALLAGCIPPVLTGERAPGANQNASQAEQDAAASTPLPVIPPGAGGGSATDFSADPAYAQWFDQSIDWQPCSNGFQCATIAAPLSWADPGAGSIELAMQMHPATGTNPGDRIGSLLTNPGGPGASGIEFIDFIWSSFGAPVRAAYDVIGFDPRGVGGSTAVVCFDDAAKDEFLSADFANDAAGLAAEAAANAAWGAACAENTGPLFGQVDTISAARDMDLIRHLVHDDVLNYLGFSYGTQLGAAYAGLFPDRVGRMVLDGAVDITLSDDELSLGQAVGFENALRAFVADCQAMTACPMDGDVEAGMAQISDLLQGAFENPLPTEDDRPLTRNLAFKGVAVALYDQASWQFLRIALQQALAEGRGDFLLFLADFYNDRNEDGTFSSNSTEAFIAVGCLDGRGATDPAEMDAWAAEIEAAAPTVGFFFTHGGIGCHEWPYPVVVGDYDIHAPGAAPILVIGTTGDPATPFTWAVALADTLDSGVLVAFEGEGHTAYTRSNACLDGVVDAFLVAGEVPTPGLTC